MRSTGMANKIIILQAVPGSGKSTYAKKHWPDAKVVSADAYFMVDGEYRYDERKIGEAHRSGLREFVGWVTASPVYRPPVVVVDNTNLTRVEMAPYADLANAFGWEVEVHSFIIDVEIAIRRNTHGAELHKWEVLAEKMEPPMPYWGKHVMHTWWDGRYGGPDGNTQVEPGHWMEDGPE